MKLLPEEISHLQLSSIVFRGSSDATYTEIQRLAHMVGVEAVRLNPSDRRDGVLQFTTDGCPEGYVDAQFHEAFAPYFSFDTTRLHCRTESARIMELMVAVGVTTRGKVIGVVGAHGGSGASSLCIRLAYELARSAQNTALVDLDPASAGIELLCSMVGVPGKRWADIHGQGALLAGQLNQALPLWKGLRILSADERGGAPSDGDAGLGALSALAQVNAWTVADLPRTALVPGSAPASLIEWCDYLVVVTACDSIHLAGTHSLLGRLARRDAVSIVAMGVRSKNEAAHVAQTLGVTHIHAVRYERDYMQACEHGLVPGERIRSGFSKDVRGLAEYLVAVMRSG